MSEADLRNRHILVVEDEYFLATEMAEELAAAGAVVLGPAPTIEAALALIDGADGLDGALLDVNLGGRPVFPVAEKLMERGVPFMLATGYSARDLPARFAETPRVEKPLNPHAVCRELAAIMTAA